MALLFSGQTLLPELRSPGEEAWGEPPVRPPLPTPRPRGPVHKTPACCLRPGGLLCDGQSAVFSLGEACGSCFTSSPGTAHQADVAFQLGVHMNRAEATSSVLSRSPLRRPAAAPTAGSRHGRDRARRAANALAAGPRAAGTALPPPTLATPNLPRPGVSRPVTAFLCLSPWFVLTSPSKLIYLMFPTY